jgi:hypothetical protein
VAGLRYRTTGRKRAASTLAPQNGAGLRGVALARFFCLRQHGNFSIFLVKFGAVAQNFTNKL